MNACCLPATVLGAALATLASSAIATSPAAPAWQPMREIVFDSAVFASTGSTADRELLQVLWADDLAKPRQGAGGRKLPAFTLLGDVPPSGQRPRIVFSMFAAAGNTRCADAANGAEATDIYNVCTMRVAAWPLGTEQRTIELPGYCMIFGNSDRQRNRTEYSVQPGPGLTVQFRTIQFGTVVQACNRAMTLD